MKTNVTRTIPGPGLPRPPFHVASVLLAFASVMFVVTPAVMAQGGTGVDPATGVRQVSWFQMFFVPPGDRVGLLIIWLLLLMSAVSLALTIKYAMQYRRPMLLPSETRQEIDRLIAQKNYRDAIEYAQGDASYLGRLAGAALSEAPNGYGAMERAIEEVGDAETTRILRPVEYLNVMGNIAPMIGLFGTVYGMIMAFQSLVASGGKPDPVDLAGGISTALVTTFWGLVVAIPALAAYALIRNKIDALTAEGMVIAEQMIGPFKPAGKLEDPLADRPTRPRATPQPER